MEPFVVSARKYRPQTFKDVVGQQSITQTLTNAIEHNHLAQALLFCGPRGVGKTTCARILAKKINDDGSHDVNEDFAFNIFELDAASNNSVDDIRSLIDQVRIPPQVGNYKVYIIDEVHMLSQSAFNAFLKTLEEPPKHAIFILATTEKHKIIPTILSRCQIFDFKRITVKDAANYLKYIAENQGVEADDDALHIIAQKADGAMRDALSIFDRVVSFSGKQLTRKAVTENLNVLDYDTYFATTDLLLQHNIPGILLLFNQTLGKGFDGHHFISGLGSHFRDLMVCQHPDTIGLLEVGEEAEKKYREQAQHTSNGFLLKAIDIANDADLKYKASRNQRLLVELALMKLASINFDLEKKNLDSNGLSNVTSDFIVPASFYKNKPVESLGTQKAVTPPAANATIPSKIEHTVPPTQIPELVGEDSATPTPVQVAPIDKNNFSEIAHTDIQTIPQITVEEPIIAKEISVAVTAAAIAEPVTTPSKDNAETGFLVNEATPEYDKKPIISDSEITAVTQEKKVISDIQSKRVSALSIASLKAKKAHELSQKESEVDQNTLPKTSFTQERLEELWHAFVQKIDSEGQKILASNLNVDLPKLQEDGFTIAIQLPNDTMKKEVEREQYELINHLRTTLNNHFISLTITVNEESAKKFAFTPEEKYEKLREKNPVIDLLRQEFDLDLS